MGSTMPDALPQMCARLQVDVGLTLDSSPASFYLALGLRSFVGRNLKAAAARLRRCKQEIEAQGGEGGGAVQQEVPGGALAALEAQAGMPGGAAAAAGPAATADTVQSTASSSGHAAITVAGSGAAAQGSACTPVLSLDAATLACRLGAVCGSLGDCYRQMGDLPAAAAAYEESCGHVRPVAEEDAAAAHALSVSLNKLGDLVYVQVQARVTGRVTGWVGWLGD